MALEKQTVIYEFLVRGRRGAVSGAHVQFSTLILEDGVIISETPQDVMPVDIGMGKGFPLADILPMIQIEALKAVDAAKAETEAKQVELDAMAEQLGAATTQIATLQRQVESATIIAGPVTVN